MGGLNAGATTLETARIQARDAANLCRYQPGQTRGHYESYFVRANHPTRPLAFWIRYTIYSPRNHPEAALGEAWAVFFDGARPAPLAVKQELPFADCVFARDRLSVSIGACDLQDGHLSGTLQSQDHRIAWRLTWSGGDAPIFLLPSNMYQARFPQAKTLVPAPNVVLSGLLTVDGEPVQIANWVGSQNHNWGSKHTDRHAWGQIAGFDNAPGSFLEIASARLKLGPVWTPHLTPIVLRHAGREYALNSIGQTLRAKTSISDEDWRFASETSDVAIEGHITGARGQFAELNYYDPGGGTKRCRNTKIARCELTLTDKRKGKTEVLRTENRAAFELLD